MASLRQAYPSHREGTLFSPDDTTARYQPPLRRESKTRKKRDQLLKRQESHPSMHYAMEFCNALVPSTMLWPAHTIFFPACWCACFVFPLFTYTLCILHCELWGRCCIVCALRGYCACRCRDTHPRLPITCLIAWRSSKAHMMKTKLPSNWCSNVPMNKPLSLVRYNYARAHKMHTCSSGKCHTRVYHLDGGHTIGNKHHHHFPPPQRLPPPLPTRAHIGAHEAKVHRVDT